MTFYWGTGHSSFQVEGQPADSDWRAFTQTPGKIKDGTNAERATEFWTRYDEDFALAESAGLNAFRISLAWERIEPRPGEFDAPALEHYRQIILKMKARGLEPMVTLHHFVLPSWVHARGGVSATDFPNLFANYAHHCIQGLGPIVKFWMTFNEPNVLIKFGYLDGVWPPESTVAARAIVAMANLAEAHLRTVQQIEALAPDFELHIGIAQHWRVFQPKNRWNPLHSLISRLSDRVFNRQILDSIQERHPRAWMPGAKKITRDKVFLRTRKPLDFLGINYYGRLLVSVDLKAPFIHIQEGPGPQSDLGWEVYPEGMYRALRQASTYRLPLIVSENGLADRQDQHRCRFLEEHIDALQRAKDAGGDIFGYLHWSITDNFEWSEGLEPRFGLVEMDYSSMSRIPRKSFYKYKDIVARLRQAHDNQNANPTKTPDAPHKNKQ